MTDESLHILGISGSLRRASFNRGLLRVAQEAAPDRVEIETFELNDIPAYNADIEAVGDPDAVRELKERIAAADALLIATPEYNGSIPGLLKNAIDWASRPPGKSVLRSKVVAVMGAAAGRSGTVRAQADLRQSLAVFACQVLQEPVVAVAKAYGRFDAQGDLKDETVREEVAALVVALEAWTRKIQAEMASDSE